MSIFGAMTGKMVQLGQRNNDALAVLETPESASQRRFPMTAPEHTIPTRVCKSCLLEKPITSFEARRDRGGRRRAVCYACRWTQICDRPGFVERKREYNNARNAKRDRALYPATTNRDPVKIAARVACKRAVQSGKLVRASVCADCKQPADTHGHHEDYSRPLDVIWLCRACHCKRHRKYA